MKNPNEIIRDRLLKECNILISNISDFLKEKEPYPEAIPILLDLLVNEDFEIITKEFIVRALTTKEAKGLANEILLKEYNKIEKIHLWDYGWVIGNAFTVIIQNSDVDAILEIVKNRENRTSRQMFIMALAKIKKRKSDIEDVLIPLLDDEDITGHVIYTLGMLKSQKAKSLIEPYLDHKKAYYRREAKKALKKIEKEELK